MALLCPTCIASALLLLLAANGTPVLLNRILGSRYAFPVDGGLCCPDGFRLFGTSKTWRGVLVATIAAGISAYILQLSFSTGFFFGALSMTGDLFASFCKRRLGLTESSQSLGLDTLPESLLPAFVLKEQLQLGCSDILALAAVFFAIEECLSPLLYRWHIRNKPY